MEKDSLDQLIERLKFHRRCTDGCLDLMAAADEAVAALAELRTACDASDRKMFPATYRAWEEKWIASEKRAERAEAELERSAGHSMDGWYRITRESSRRLREMESELAMLKANSEQLLSDILDPLEKHAEHAEAHIAALEADRDALKQDAERYRWIRSPEAAVADVCNSAHPKADGFVFMEGDELDAAIDAAREKPNG
jgi:chromosome segregation ATPase